MKLNVLYTSCFLSLHLKWIVMTWVEISFCTWATFIPFFLPDKCSSRSNQMIVEVSLRCWIKRAVSSVSGGLCFLCTRVHSVDSDWSCWFRCVVLVERSEPHLYGLVSLSVYSASNLLVLFNDSILRKGLRCALPAVSAAAACSSPSSLWIHRKTKACWVSVASQL